MIRSHRLSVTALALAIVMALTVIACGEDDSDSGGSGAAGESLSIGVVELARAQLFSSQQHPHIEAALQKRGWETSFVDSNGSQAAAIAGMQNLIQRGVDVLVVQTYAATELGAGLAAAERAGIPVFSTGGGEAGEGMAGAVEFINAKPVNDVVVKALEGKGKVALLRLGYTPGAPCRARAEDLESQLSDNPDVSITKKELVFPGADKSAQESTSGWLKSNPEAEGTTHAIWVCTSDAIAGVLAAQKQLGRGPYPLWTWDLSDPAREAAENGSASGVLSMPAPDSAEQLAQMIADWQKDPDAWTPETVPAPSVLVTPENVANVNADGELEQ